MNTFCNSSWTHVDGSKCHLSRVNSGALMANGTTKNMPEWKKVTISYCHRNWNHQRPVELQFNKKSIRTAHTSGLCKNHCWIKWKWEINLAQDNQSLFSLIGGFKHPTDIQIEDFKTKCIERGVGTFQVEIQFDIHRVEPMGEESKTRMY